MLHHVKRIPVQKEKDGEEVVILDDEIQLIFDRYTGKTDSAQLW